MTDCPRTGKLFGGCKFSPRYDAIPPADTDVSGAAGGVVLYVKAMTKHLYVHDICERCGRVVKREAAQ